MGLRERVTRHGEEAIGKLASELLENPMVSSALSAAFETRERALRAQEAAMGALNLPSASDLERLTRRLRGVSQRLEGIEDGLDRLEQPFGQARRRGSTQAGHRGSTQARRRGSTHVRGSGSGPAPLLTSFTELSLGLGPAS